MYNNSDDDDVVSPFHVEQKRQHASAICTTEKGVITLNITVAE